ncbi:VanZ like protein [Microbacterium sp. SLBN-146]|nr:VanZ like protein [Microbacterium sp. SLBN-146]
MLVALGAYVLAVALVVLTPVSYEGVIHAISDLARDGLGIDWFGSGWIEFAANIAMFVPLGFLLTLLFRHHWYGVAIALALSALVEIAQIVIPSRQPSVRDIVANVLGAAIGAVLAWLLVVRREKKRATAEVES